MIDTTLVLLHKENTSIFNKTLLSLDPVSFVEGEIFFPFDRLPGILRV